MNDNDDTSNVFPFPRIGFTLNPTTLPDPGPAPSPDPDTTPTLPRRARRSPLDALNALPDPGLTAPLVPYTPAPAPTPGMLPDTFRGDPAPDMVGPRLGALSLAAILAVAVAALRGTATYLQDRRQRRLERAGEADPIRQARLKHQLAMQQAGYDRQLAGAKHTAAMQGLGAKAAQQRAKTSRKVPSSNAFGAKSLSGRSSTGSGSGRGKSGGGGSSSSGSGSSRNGSGGLKNGRGNARHPKTTKKRNGGLFGGGSGTGGTGAGGGKGMGGGRGPKKPKSPHRGSQGAGAGGLKKNSPGGRGAGGKKTNGAGSGNSPAGTGGQKKRGGRTTLPEALKNTAQKTAARRLKQRRKNPGNPVLWGGNKPGGKNKQLPGGAGKGKGKGQAGGNNGPAKLNQPQTPGRVHLGQALKNAALKAARKRLKQRRRNLATPPIWAAGGNNNQKAANGPATPQGGKNAGNAKAAAAARRKQRAKVNGKKQGARQRAAWWANMRAKARRKVNNGGCFPGGPAAGQGTPGGGQQGAQPGPGAYVPPPRGAYGGKQRKSPFQNAGQAAAQAGTTYTVTSEHVPGSNAKRWEPDALTQGTPALPATGPAALNAAPTSNPPRPGTTRPKEAIPMPLAPGRPDPRIAKARNQAARTGRQVVVQARHMAPEHETEITLDDALDEYGDFASDGFKTHDQCKKLAGRAVKLRDILAVFAEELAVSHNLIGFLFTGAMARMSESMDLVARMAEEMEASSIEAAEMAEAADNELNDTYRPIVTATADAGLTTPSAPIHNQT